MFRNAVRQTPFTTAEADSFFENITADSFQYDVTIKSMLRALLEPRMSETDSIYAGYTSGGFSRSTIERESPTDMVNKIIDPSGVRDNQMWFYSLTSYQEDNKKAIELIESKFTEMHPDWQKLGNIREFYRKQFYVICFVQPEKKSVLIFIDGLDHRKLHLLLSSLPAMLPWYFTKEVGITEQEMALLKSLREKTPDNFLMILGEMVQKYDFRTMRIRNLLRGFETRYERTELESVRRDIQSCYDDMESLNRSYSNCLTRVRDLEIRAMGLDAKINSENGEDSEIMEYFLCNKSVILESVSDDGTMTFVTKTYLEYFDEDMAARMIDNHNSVIYRPSGRACNNYIQADDMKKLMTAIFVDQTLKIKFCSAYKFSLNGYVQARSGYRYPVELNDRMPNTHIDIYSCLGSYETHINSALREHNYIGAIEQCIASGKSLNFGDGTVMEKFIRRFYGIDGEYANRKFIELPDGTSVTPKEAVAWLNSQEEATNE